MAATYSGYSCFLLCFSANERRLPHIFISQTWSAIKFQQTHPGCENKAQKRLVSEKVSRQPLGMDKDTVRNLYLGYIWSAMEYNSSLPTTCSKSNPELLGRVQNSGLWIISDYMRVTPIAAGEIHANMLHEILRDKSAIRLGLYRRGD